MRKVKVAALQFSCSKDVQENINKAEKMVKEEADEYYGVARPLHTVK